MPEARVMYTVSWKKIRESSQAERDFLHYHIKASADDSTYMIDQDTLDYLEDEITAEDKKTFAPLLASLHKLIEKRSEEFVLIT